MIRKTKKAYPYSQSPSLSKKFKIKNFREMGELGLGFLSLALLVGSGGATYRDKVAFRLFGFWRIIRLPNWWWLMCNSLANLLETKGWSTKFRVFLKFFRCVISVSESYAGFVHRNSRVVKDWIYLGKKVFRWVKSLGFTKSSPCLGFAVRSCLII